MKKIVIIVLMSCTFINSFYPMMQEEAQEENKQKLETEANKFNEISEALGLIINMIHQGEGGPAISVTSLFELFLEYMKKYDETEIMKKTMQYHPVIMCSSTLLDNMAKLDPSFPIYANYKAIIDLCKSEETRQAFQESHKLNEKEHYKQCYALKVFCSVLVISYYLLFHNNENMSIYSVFENKITPYITQKYSQEEYSTDLKPLIKGTWTKVWERKNNMSPVESERMTLLAYIWRNQFSEEKNINDYLEFTVLNEFKTTALSKNKHIPSWKESLDQESCYEKLSKKTHFFSDDGTVLPLLLTPIAMGVGGGFAGYYAAIKKKLGKWAAQNPNKVALISAIGTTVVSGGAATGLFYILKKA